MERKSEDQFCDESMDVACDSFRLVLAKYFVIIEQDILLYVCDACDIDHCT